MRWRRGVLGAGPSMGTQNRLPLPRPALSSSVMKEWRAEPTAPQVGGPTLVIGGPALGARLGRQTCPSVLLSLPVPTSVHRAHTLSYAGTPGAPSVHPWLGRVGLAGLGQGNGGWRLLGIPRVSRGHRRPLAPWAELQAVVSAGPGWGLPRPASPPGPWCVVTVVSHSRSPGTPKNPWGRKDRGTWEALSGPQFGQGRDTGVLLFPLPAGQSQLSSERTA